MMQNLSKRSMSESNLKFSDQSAKGTKAVRSTCNQKYILHNCRNTPSEKGIQGQTAIKHQCQDNQDIFGPRKSEADADLRRFVDFENSYEEKRRKLLAFIEDQKDYHIKAYYLKEYEQVLNKLDKIYRQYERRERKFRKDYGRNVYRLHLDKSDNVCPYESLAQQNGQVQQAIRSSKEAHSIDYD